MKIYQCVKCGKVCFELHETTRHREQHEDHAFKEIEAIHLPLKAKWYDMIESGEKKEEYRLLSPHWLKLFCWTRRIVHCKNDSLKCDRCYKVNSESPYPFNAVVFRYRYTKKLMVWSVDNISIGQGRTEWGAPNNKDTFIIKLKDRLL